MTQEEKTEDAGRVAVAGEGWVAHAERERGGGGGGRSQMKHQGKIQRIWVCCHGSCFWAVPGAAGQQGHGAQAGH